MPKFIDKLKPNEIFVYGTNASGIHGGGAALQARKFGALLGASKGPTGGQTYGIETLTTYMQQVSLEYIREQLKELKFTAMMNPDYTFLLTPIGTGIAGFEYEVIESIVDAVNFGENVKKVGWDE